MKELTFQSLDASMIPDCGRLSQKVYAQPPWNESWESAKVIYEFFHNPVINNYFVGYVAKRGTELLASALVLRSRG